MLIVTVLKAHLPSVCMCGLVSLPYTALGKHYSYIVLSNVCFTYKKTAVGLLCLFSSFYVNTCNIHPQLITPLSCDSVLLCSFKAIPQSPTNKTTAWFGEGEQQAASAEGYGTFTQPPLQSTCNHSPWQSINGMIHTGSP